jgi:hypothetical protein
LGNLRSVGKATLRTAGDTARKEVENVRRTIREFSRIKGLATKLLVTIISIVKPKGGQLTHYWSACNEGGRGDGSKDSEMHIDVGFE